MSSSPPPMTNHRFSPSLPLGTLSYPNDTLPPSQTATVRPRRQPRLSPTPRLFRDIFSPAAANGVRRALPNAQFRQSFVDVSRALTDANRAVQHAEQALQPTPVVDLTDSPPRQAPQPSMSTTSRQQARRGPATDAYSGSTTRPAPSTNHAPEAPLSLAEVREILGDRTPQEYIMRRLQEGPSRADIQRDEDWAIQQQREARVTWQQRQQRAQQSQTSTRPPSASSTDSQRTVSDIKHFDLAKHEAKCTMGTALAKQRQDAVSSQRSPAPPTARSALTGYKCPICMETPKDASSTICGHLFCHRCIIDTLKWSEHQRTVENGRKTDGVCPVCRKTLKRSKDKAGPGRHIIPLQVKLVTKKKLNDKGKKRAWAESEVVESEKRKREDTKSPCNDTTLVGDSI